MSHYIDLHIHTVFSDGTMTPYEIIKDAHVKEIAVLSITDHDSTSGINEALNAGQQFGVSVIPGVELSTNSDEEIHILGYFIDINSENMQNYFKLMKEKEVYWVIKTLNKLKKLNINITIDKILNKNRRVNYESIALEMVKKQYVKSCQEAQTQYFNKGMPAYVEVYRYSPEQCIQLIEQANGIPVLAHPMRISENSDEVFKIIKKLMKFGLKGIECFHPSNSLEFTNELLIFAAENNLCVSGGSDFHGLNKYVDLGESKVPLGIFNTFLGYHNKIL